MTKGLMAGVVLMLAAPVAGQGVSGARAPVHGWTAVERRAVDASDPSWAAAAVHGVPMRDGPVVIPSSLPGDPLQVGVNSVPPGGPIVMAKHAAVIPAGNVWRVRVDAPGADGLRLKLTGLNLGTGESIVVAGRGPGYVVRGRGAGGNGTEWTPVLDGEHAYVEWRGAAGSRPGFSISEVAEIVWPRSGGGVTDLLPCHVDVRCETVDEVARDSVGRMVYSTPLGTFVCSGALLNDTDAQTTLGWLLTSSACINTQAAAQSLSVYWFYQTPACGGEAPDLGTLPVSQGADLVTLAPSTGASLLRLSQDPSQGQGLAGWTADEPTGVLTTIHHPEGSFKRIARGEATVNPPRCFGVYSYYQYHSLDYTLGITEAGSVGAPLFDSSWKVVGQLQGFCSIAPPTCTNPAQWNAVFGRFSRTLPLVRAALTGQTSPTRLYVDASATGAGTGLSWTDAYTSLAAALASISPPAGGTEVWVADGTYKPGGQGRQSAFHLVSGVSIYGGFAGGETLLSQRNPAQNVAILSGDLAGDDGPAFANRADNALHVVLGTGVDSSAVLDGFTIKGGNADGPSSFDDKGGGLYVEAGSPRIMNCVFEDNLGSFSGGGAAWFTASGVDAAACVFRGNRATFGGGASLTSAGGTLTACTFEQNTALNDGGGLDLYESAPDVVQCVFKNNAAADSGGGLSMFASLGVDIGECTFDGNTAAGGGAAHIAGGSVEFRRSVFVGNTVSNFGGAIVHRGGAQTSMSACRILGNIAGRDGGAVHANAGTLALVNCELSGNRSSLRGGSVELLNSATLSMLNCTLSANVSGTVCGGVAVNSGSATITNSVLHGNTDSTGNGEDAQVRIGAGASATVSFSLVQGWTGTLGGAGNIGGDPLFAAPLGPDQTPGTPDDDLALREGSPARDAGNNGPISAVALDLRGNARREDDPCTVDTGSGTAPIVDMGAIEAAPCANVCYANCDGSTAAPVLTANDFVCFLERYATASSYANCDESTVAPVLTANDFVCFVSEYAIGCS